MHLFSQCPEALDTDASKLYAVHFKDARKPFEVNPDAQITFVLFTQEPVDIRSLYQMFKFHPHQLTHHPSCQMTWKMPCWKDLSDYPWKKIPICLPLLQVLNCLRQQRVKKGIIPFLMASFFGGSLILNN